ncbi:MAG: hypothetical protein JOZ47_07375 [Kutzneria sp.]|nr:hypothetical protein [Kutzneria sp.]MBV9844878.1 hypothetical protein [Kutzneria sp.]
MDKPLLLLDVDGPLNPFAARPHRCPQGYATYRTKPSSWISANAPKPAFSVPPLRVWLNAEHGARLKALPYDLVWATTWTHEANEWIGPPLDLPELPFVNWPRPRRIDPEGLHWKTRYAVEWVAGRPFAWVDDEIGQADRDWVALHHDAPALLHWVSPRRGLVEEDFRILADWARWLLCDGGPASSGPG